MKCKEGGGLYMQTPHKKQKVQVDVVDEGFHKAATEIAGIIAEEEASMPNQVLPKRPCRHATKKSLKRALPHTESALTMVPSRY